MKVMLLFGTRPEAIKMAPVAKVLRAEPKLDVFVCVTGQHRHMLDQVLDIFDLDVDLDMALMKPNQGLSELTSRLLAGVTDTIEQLKPDVILVHGDTTTAMASSLAAFYAGIPVGHVEAGLRSSNIRAPFPEEFNRQVISKIATFHYSPTEKATKNLVAEGVERDSICQTGNTVIDALLMVTNRFEQDSDFRKSTDDNLSNVLGFDHCSHEFTLVTGHRRENFGDGIQGLCNALTSVVTTHPEHKIVYPVHYNPNVQAPVYDALGSIENIHLIEPVDYVSFVRLMQNSRIILTDSGGVQEEAPVFGKPVLVMRENTERPEAIEAGVAKLVGAEGKRIFAAMSSLITDEQEYARMERATNPFGDGYASARIRDSLLSMIQQTFM